MEMKHIYTKKKHLHGTTKEEEEKLNQEKKTRNIHRCNKKKMNKHLYNDSNKTHKK